MEGEGGPDRALIGYACLAAGVLDGLLALYFGLARPPADERARRNLPLIFGISAFVLLGIGAAFLLGVFAKEG